MGQVGHFTGQLFDLKVLDVQRHGGKAPMFYHLPSPPYGVLLASDRRSHAEPPPDGVPAESVSCRQSRFHAARSLFTAQAWIGCSSRLDSKTGSRSRIDDHCGASGSTGHLLCEKHRAIAAGAGSLLYVGFKAGPLLSRLGGLSAP